LGRREKESISFRPGREERGKEKGSFLLQDIRKGKESAISGYPQVSSV